MSHSIRNFNQKALAQSRWGFKALRSTYAPMFKLAAIIMSIRIGSNYLMEVFLLIHTVNQYAEI
ncbi:hypothetical protein STW0522KLE44_46570 [Klebsiella sp. STW0522-44]|nr:hypothetical protein STW0522KLE44_46570 [Klebsiella sp. STW0522-44]